MIKCIKYNEIDQAIFENGRTYLIMWADPTLGHTVEYAMFSDSQPYSEGKVWWFNDTVNDDGNPTHILCNEKGIPIVVDDLEVEQ